MGIVQEIQSYVTVGSVGSSSQQMAGHIWAYADLDAVLSNWSTLAYYKFASGALTTDETGTYGLTNNNAATNTTGILNTNFATALDGVNQYYTETTSTLLDAPSGLTNGIAVAIWFKATDGQPASTESLFSKVNDETGGSEDFMVVYIATDGTINFVTAANAAGGTTLSANKKLVNGNTLWHLLIVNWDTTNGKRIWIDGALSKVDSSATTLMSDGATRDFSIGAYMFGGASQWFAGSIAQVLVADAKLTQRDVDFLCATTIAEPSLLIGRDYTITSKMQKKGDTDFTREDTAQIVTKYNGNIYRQGYQYDQNDKVRHWGWY